MDWTADPEKMKKAKELAAGPVGEILSKFPAYYAKAVLFGERLSKSGESVIRNGTVTLLRLPDIVVALTCYHVIKEYRSFLSEYKNVVCQIGDILLDPLDQLVDENDKLDLAVIHLTEDQVVEITKGGEIGSRLVDGSSWPPQQVKPGEPVMLAGFPGNSRELLKFDELEFRPFCAAGIRVNSVHDEKFSCQFEREYWITSFGEKTNPSHLKILGGMSGGPAFVDRGVRWEFAGIIYEHQPEYDLMFLRPAHLIAADGTIKST
jgi:hypothetical protein